MENNGNGFKDRIGIEQRLSCLETTVNEIKNNHLVHIEAKIDRIQWLFILTLVGIVADLISKVVQ